MVEITKWNRINQSKFWDFVGLSLFNISIGLSVHIAKAESSVFENNYVKFAVAKTAIELTQRAEQLEVLADRIDPKTPGRKKTLIQVTEGIVDTKNELNQIVGEEL